MGYAPFEPRAVGYHGIRKHAGHRLKVYSVRCDERPLDEEGFEEGMAAAFDLLPRAEPGAGRPGLGFVIAHQGRGADYVVLCWWARENELPTRVWIREGKSGWRSAQEESFCVWDLDIMKAERDAYVDTVLGPGDSADPAADYLARTAVSTGGGVEGS